MNTSQAASHARQQAAARLPSRPPRQGKPHVSSSMIARRAPQMPGTKNPPRGSCQGAGLARAGRGSWPRTGSPMRQNVHSGPVRAAAQATRTPHLSTRSAPDPIGTEGPMAAPIGGSGAGQTGTCAGERGGIALAARCLTRQPPGSNPVARPAAAVHGRACPAGGYVGLRPGEPADYRFPRPVGQPADQQALRRTAPEPQAPGDPAPAAGRSARRHRPATRPRRSARSVAPGRRCRSQTNLRISAIRVRPEVAVRDIRILRTAPPDSCRWRAKLPQRVCHYRAAPAT